MAFLLSFFFGCGPRADPVRLRTNQSEQAEWEAIISSHPPQAEEASPPALAMPEPAIPLPREDGDSVATLVDARPAAIVNGRSVLFGDLRAALAEAAGAQVLQEIIIDRKLELLLREAGITITADHVAAERSTLLTSLSDDGGKALRLLDELRAQQGLGSHRFAALMHRNASLRALVRSRVRITEQAILQMFDVAYGPKRQVRLLTVPNLASAQTAADRIRRGESFSEVAVALSTDASAARGGLLEPISQLDPSYPAALRDAVWLLEAPDEVSGPILLENGYALVQFVRDVEGEDVNLDSVRADLESTVRLSQERLLMDQLARKILKEAQLTIFDDSLRESWRFAQSRE